MDSKVTLVAISKVSNEWGLLNTKRECKGLVENWKNCDNFICFTCDNENDVRELINKLESDMVEVNIGDLIIKEYTSKFF